MVTSDGTFPATILQARPATQDEIDGLDLSTSNLNSSISSNNDVNTSAPLQDRSFSYVRLTVTEGKHRMVRRILHNCGHSVVKLHRNRYGRISLYGYNGDEELLQGSIRRCNEDETEWAKQITNK